MLYQNAQELIGKTPLLQAAKYSEAAGGCKANLFAKLEMFNPAGSVKDRIASSLIETAEAEGILKPGSIILEPTSGNTGIGLAAVGTAKGYQVVIVLPDSLSVERRAMIQAYGAQLILTPGKYAVKGAIAYANELAAKDSRYVILGQFTNPANPKVHYETTGPEIYQDLAGKVDVLVAGIGTGGTLSGAGNYLKEHTDVYVVGVEPAKSPFLTEGKAGPHGIQGIGAGFAPDTLDLNIADEVVTVADEDAVAQARLFGHTEGLFVGISAGAALYAAKTLASREEFTGKNIAVILPDSGDRYLSTALGDFPEIATVDFEM